MRVLFVVPSRFGLHRGGLELQIEKTAAGLERAGVEVVKFNPWIDGLVGVDICHGFTFDSSMLPYALEAQRRGIPFVLSPVTNLASAQMPLLNLRVQLANFLPGIFSDLRRASSICGHARVVIVQTSTEAALISQAFNVETQRVVVVPNGIDDASNFQDAGPFAERFGVKNFVLCVGSIDRNKNQETLIRAVSGTSMQLVIVGRAAVGQEAYEAHCRQIAGSNVIFTGYLEPGSVMLSSAFAAARVVAVPSFRETWALVIYEGAMAGCHLAVSSRIPLHNVLVDKVRVVPPDNANEWRDVLAEMLSNENPSDLAEIVPEALMSWAQVAEQLRNVYAAIKK